MHLFQLKCLAGFCCPNCRHYDYVEIKTRTLPLLQCKKCKHQTTVIVGTIFEQTRTPLRKWFTSIYWEAQDKRGGSAIFVSQELEISYPTTAWLLGTFHGLDSRHLQSYLDEFCFISLIVESSWVEGLTS